MNIYNTTGQVIQSNKLNPKLLQQRIFLNDLANGVYFVNFTYNGQHVATREVKCS
ncbi:MAG: T9SS type A sorting domain-containing protein [Chitinophagales bacterium]